MDGRDNRTNDFVIVDKTIHEPLFSNLRWQIYDRVKFPICVPALDFENGRHLDNPNDCPVPSPLASLVRQILDLNQGAKIAL